jgi:hypothetical protein
MTSITEIHCVDDRGARRIIRWIADTLRYSTEDRDTYVSQIRANYARSERYTEADANAIIGAVEWPERYTPFTILQFDAEGNFWILERARGASGERVTRFRILDAEGRQIAFADSLPTQNAGLNTRAYIGANVVIRPIEDADGVPMVGVFRIRKGQ